MHLNAGRKSNGLDLKYKLSISGSTTEDDQGDNSTEYKTQESTVTIQTVTSQQPEKETVDFNETLDVHGDTTSHTFSNVRYFCYEMIYPLDKPNTKYKY